MVVKLNDLRTRQRSAYLTSTMLVLLATLPTSRPALAQTPEFLNPGDAVKAVVDGRPWSALTGNGRKARITLNKDGTGTFEGPLTLSITWEIKAADLCLKLGFPGTKCIRFRRIANGYEGYADGKLDLTLTR
jgi:hypothetical protein